MGNYLESSCPLDVAAATAPSLLLKFLLAWTLLVANDGNPIQIGLSRKGKLLAHKTNKSWCGITSGTTESGGLSLSTFGSALLCVALSEAVFYLVASAAPHLPSANLTISEERFFCPVFPVRVLESDLFGLS